MKKNDWGFLYLVYDKKDDKEENKKNSCQRKSCAESYRIRVE